MELGEIISDALVYPFQNIKALIIYAILGIILGIAVGGTVFGMVASSETHNVLAALGSGIIGVIVAIILGFFISGYELDIVKYGIERSSAGPEIDFVRQFFNGFKYFIVSIVYMIVPMILSAIFGFIFSGWLSTVLSVIVGIIFALALMMGQCRLAKTEDLGYALSIGEAIGDISRVGFGKLIAFILLVVIIMIVLLLVVGLINNLNSTVGGILLVILGVYLTFFSARATGLLYSEV
jgi:hypothetical protein